MCTKYPSLAIGAARRLDMFKREAATGKWSRPMTWRDVRFATLKSPTGLNQGFNGEGRSRTPIWYTQDGQGLDREQFCDEVEDIRIDHTGWFTNMYQEGLARGIVARLTHGRCIAGYYLSENDERVYFPEVFDDIQDAARMADEHARVIGEAEQEYAQRFDEAQKLEIDIEDAFTRLRECIKLRHVECMDYVRDEISELIQTIRNNRDKLATDYKGVL